MDTFDDSLLDETVSPGAGDSVLRPLAEAGARLRQESSLVADVVAGLMGEVRPRAVIAVGPEARLLRAVLEPVCPVPMVAWPSLGLPGWVGPLDLVVVLGGRGEQGASGLHEALRRGSRILVVAPPESRLARESAARATTLLPVTASSDPYPAAVAALSALHAFRLGPSVDPEAVAEALDRIAVECGHRQDVTVNPAKMLALDLADAQPLVWGGSILAARAARRVAESIREASGRMALAADAADLLPLLEETLPRDPFADPIEGETVLRPTLVIIDDAMGDDDAVAQQERLQRTAEARDVRVSVLRETTGDQLTRYASLLGRGMFAAAYLRIGLGRV